MEFRPKFYPNSTVGSQKKAKSFNYYHSFYLISVVPPFSEDALALSLIFMPSFKNQWNSFQINRMVLICMLDTIWVYFEYGWINFEYVEFTFLHGRIYYDHTVGIHGQ